MKILKLTINTRSSELSKLFKAGRMVEYKNLHKDIKNQYDEVNILSDKIKVIQDKKVIS
jgi:hypothetical protein